MRDCRTVVSTVSRTRRTIVPIAWKQLGQVFYTCSRSALPAPNFLPPMTYVFTSLAGGARGVCARRPIRLARPDYQTGCIPSMRCHLIHRHDRSSLPLPAPGCPRPAPIHPLSSHADVMKRGTN
jgi:hypothetical protein